VKLPSLGSIPNDAVLWGGLAILGLSTWAMASSRYNDYFPAPKPMAKANFAWSEGMPWRDRSVWYQWKSDFGTNDPTKRLTVA
jgi:hypothetical protein